MALGILGENMEQYCINCMNPLEQDGRCRICGNLAQTAVSTPRCLEAGTILLNRYLIGKVLGEGSFGITYIGRDLLLETVVAIKEYFPLNLVSRDVRSSGDHALYTLHGDPKSLYQKGLKQFYNEAKILSRFQKLEGIVSVYNLFYENNTAYLVMEYVSGVTLKEYVKENGPVTGENMLFWIKPIIQSLVRVHEADIIHRDISPDNLLLTEDKKLVLIDFGAARIAGKGIGQNHTILFKRGYTPEEQYLRHGKIGTWSDVYSLCATIYYMLTGIVPNEAIERMLYDRVVSLTDMPEIRLTIQQKEAIMQGMSVKLEQRVQDMKELYQKFYYREKDDVQHRIYQMINMGQHQGQIQCQCRQVNEAKRK